MVVSSWLGDSFVCRVKSRISQLFVQLGKFMSFRTFTTSKDMSARKTNRKESTPKPEVIEGPKKISRTVSLRYKNRYHRSYKITPQRKAQHNARNSNHYSCHDCAKRILRKHGFALTSYRKIGYGRYSKVYEGAQLSPRRKVAVKVIDTSKITDEFKRKFLPREICLWMRLRHPHLVELIDCFQKDGKICLPMELAELGDLLAFVQKNGAQSEWQGQQWMKQLVSAVQFMHDQGVAHRDLKLENILLFANNSVKIADFGFCRQVKDGEFSMTHCGSRSYSAPEVLLAQMYLPFKADIWSLGVIAFILLTNRMPYNEHVDNLLKIVEAQKTRAYRYPQKILLSSSCRECIDTIMTFDYRQRPDIRGVAKLHWLNTTIKKPEEIEAPNDKGDS